MVLVPFQILVPTYSFVYGKWKCMPLHFLNDVPATILNIDFVRQFHSCFISITHTIKIQISICKTILYKRRKKTNLIDVPRIEKVAREETLSYLERGLYDEN